MYNLTQLKLLTTDKQMDHMFNSYLSSVLCHCFHNDSLTQLDSKITKSYYIFIFTEVSVTILLYSESMRLGGGYVLRGDKHRLL